MRQYIEYIPLVTTLFSLFFFQEIFSHYRKRKTNYLLWWSVGVLTFGLGTLTESINALFGWNSWNVRAWYVFGALLGGFPLAQGTVYLLMSKSFASFSTKLILSVILVAATCVFLTPISIPEGYDFRLSGSVFQWEWVRYFSPAINIYSFIFLFGGAVYSAIRYFKKDPDKLRFHGNIYIAIGALLPGIGGSFTRAGYVEVLFITELIGLILIYYGYKIIKTSKA